MNYGVVNGRIANALAVVGDRWSLEIIGELFGGYRRFEALRRQLGISRGTLTRRLEALARDGVLVKRRYSNSRHEYGLSEKGRALGPFLLLAWRWEQVWADAEMRQDSPTQLFHLGCDAPLVPVAVCADCREPVTSGDLAISEHVSRSPIFHNDIRPGRATRRVGAAKDGEGDEVHLQRVAELIGDRWTLLILMAVFFGTGRYEGFTQLLGISSNSLASRLGRLVEVGILVRYDYQQNPPRSEYAATIKGRALYPVIMALRQWAADWGEGPEPAPLIHRDHPARLHICCESCQREVRRQDILLAAPRKGQLATDEA